uniref:Uncharacterized protein n=1 Tax=Fabrea salina TaxID=342563 RepID=A0A7S3MSG7_9CILI|mmetsp:Transcript_899/g.1399  ORF Transcript_899/g.1399 Transcript_899/m.1399 type:complete len:124 (+) Transcript_899:26-397(+)
MEERTQNGSVKKTIQQVENNIQELQGSLREYKQLVETTRAEVNSMDNKITLAIEDTPKSISPQIQELLGDLNQEMKRQQALNDHLQKQITGLRKEKSVLSQHIIASNSRCQILEDSVGYTHSQ